MSLRECNECGCERVYFVTGAICPRGHGKILSFPSRTDFRKAVEAERVAKLPVATVSGTKAGRRVYTINGKAYRRVHIMRDDSIEASCRGEFGDYYAVTLAPIGEKTKKKKKRVNATA